MGTSKAEKYAIQWKKFWGRFIFWCLCIPVNIIPILLRHAHNLTPGTFLGIKDLVVVTVGDFDFLFISLSVVFVLCIEGFFAEGEVAKIYSKFQLGALLYAFCLLALYMYFFFKPDMFSSMGDRGTFTYNLVLIGLTIVIGALCNATISMKRSVNE
ncbi:MAG: hypothetical protein IKX20_09770 [Paludibacteraceae bacterium]|nr:hypothetical protein [Paludibacteraceae bacterium]